MKNIKKISINIFYIFFILFCADPGIRKNQSNQYPIQVLLTDPMGNSYVSGKRIENSLKNLINNAKHSIHMAVYNFDSLPLLEALILAKKRGIKIEIVGDFKELDTPGYIAINKANLNLITGNINAIQHDKFIIIDQNILVTGTGNFSNSDFYHNDNNFLIFRDESIAGIYENEFEQMHNGFFSDIKSSSRMASDRPNSTLPVSIYFSPQESRIGLEHMIDKINRATTSIHYMIYAFSHDEIATALIMAARRGVKVYGIHDSSFVKGTSEEAPRLFMAGFANDNELYSSGPFVHADGNTNTFNINGIEHGGKMHCKTMVIDPDTDHGTVITGSFNWSSSAVENNDENLLIISDQKIVHEIKKQWDNAWKISESLDAKFGSISGSLAGFQDIVLSEIHWAGMYSGLNLSPSDDYIEILNRSSKTIDITHWTIRWFNSNQNNIFSYTFPDGNDGKKFSNSVILPGEYRVIYRSSSGLVQNTTLITKNGIKIPESKNFSLPDSSVMVEIYDRSMNLIDRADLDFLLREGYTDPLKKNTGSMNRRFKSNGKPETGWYTSKAECFWNICQNPNFYGSPGYLNEPASPVEFKKAETNDDNSVKISFSGEVNECLHPADFILVGDTGTIPIDQMVAASAANQVDFQSSAAGDILKTYTLETKAFHEFNANVVLDLGINIFLGNDYEISYSNNSGAVFQTLHINALEKRKIYQIIYDSGTATIYIATDNGLYSTINNGLSFQKVFIASPPLTDIIYDVKINTNSIFTATADGIYIASKNLQVFQKISNEPANIMYASDTLLLAGGVNAIYRFSAPFTGIPATININGNVHDIKLIGSTVYAGTTSGLYSSTDSFTFTPAYTSIFNNRSVNFIHSDLTNVPLILTYDHITEISPTGIQIFDVKQNQRSVILNTLYNNTLGLIGVGDYGFIDRNLTRLPKCNKFVYLQPRSYLPAGSVVFPGYGQNMDRSSAKIQLNEMSLVNPDGHDWLEFYVISSGSLKNTKVEYFEGDEKNILYNFPEMYVKSGDIILTDLESPLVQMRYLSDDKKIVKSNPYKFYSTHENLNPGDGLILINQNQKIIDALFYSNRDGHILSALSRGGLQHAYFENEVQQILPNRLIFPVPGWNDIKVQNSGIKIPISGNTRAIARKSFSENLWGIVANPTPGLK